MNGTLPFPLRIREKRTYKGKSFLSPAKHLFPWVKREDFYNLLQDNQGVGGGGRWWEGGHWQRSQHTTRAVGHLTVEAGAGSMGVL